MGPRNALETMVYVRDMDKAVEFYTTTLGLRLVERYENSFAIVEADEKGSRIGLMSAQVNASEPRNSDGLPSPRVVFQVADIDSERAELETKGVKVGDVGGQLGGTRGCHFWDSDGNGFFIWENGSGRLDEPGE